MIPSVKSLAVVACLCLSALIPSAASADVVLLQDNFNAENGGVGVLNYNSFANWNVSNGTVDLIGNGFFDFYPGNGLYVDLDGSTGDAGELTSILEFAPGFYRLEFDLGGSTRGDTNEVVVELGDFSETFTVNSSDPLTHIVREFETGVAGSLVFANSGGDNLGAILDNVTVTQIPEPATLVLVGLGAIGLAVFGRRARVI